MVSQTSVLKRLGSGKRTTSSGLKIESEINCQDLTPTSPWDPTAFIQGAERDGQHPSKAVFCHLWKVVETGGGHWQLEKGKHHTHLQKWQNNQPMELQVGCLTSMSRASPRGAHFWAQAGEDDWKQIPWIYWRANHAWPTWLHSAIKWWNMWVKGNCCLLFGL